MVSSMEFGAFDGNAGGQLNLLEISDNTDWYTLSHKDRYAGEVSLELTYFINVRRIHQGPPILGRSLEDAYIRFPWFTTTEPPPMPPKVAKPLNRINQRGPGGHVLSGQGQGPGSSQSLPQRRPLTTASLASLRSDGLPGTSTSSSSLSYAGGRSQYHAPPPPPPVAVDNFDRATAMLLNGANGGGTSEIGGLNGHNQVEPPRRVSFPVSSFEISSPPPSVQPFTEYDLIYFLFRIRIQQIPFIRSIRPHIHRHIELTLQYRLNRTSRNLLVLLHLGHFQQAMIR